MLHCESFCRYVHALLRYRCSFFLLCAQKLQHHMNPKGVVALLTLSATTYKPLRCRGRSVAEIDLCAPLSAICVAESLTRHALVDLLVLNVGNFRE